jgi:hypothetical protein
MNLYRRILVVLVMHFVFISAAMAGDFDWLKTLDINAKADLPGFNATLSTRFNIGGMEVKTVINSVARPADAYMVLRLGEISHQPTDYVIKQYQTYRHKGWGALAKSLGIKPGSRQFHDLKSGRGVHLNKGDGYSGHPHGHGASHGKGKGKHHSHGKNK